MKGIAPSSTLPILSGVLVRAADGVLEFQTSNYTISIRHRIAARVDEEGQVVIPCKMLSNICKTLPDAPVSFELSERQVTITCERSTFRLNTLDAGDFPEFPTFALERSVELPANILTEMVGRVWRVTSTDKNRPVLNGVYMTVENNTIRLVATDSYRLAVCDTQVETSTLEGSFELNVPAEAFNDALAITGGQGSILRSARPTPRSSSSRATRRTSHAASRVCTPTTRRCSRRMRHERQDRRGLPRLRAQARFHRGPGELRGQIRHQHRDLLHGPFRHLE